eukprot:gene3413-2364_t
MTTRIVVTQAANHYTRSITQPPQNHHQTSHNNPQSTQKASTNRQTTKVMQTTTYMEINQTKSQFNHKSCNPVIPNAIKQLSLCTRISREPPTTPKLTANHNITHKTCAQVHTEHSNQINISQHNYAFELTKFVVQNPFTMYQLQVRNIRTKCNHNHTNSPPHRSCKTTQLNTLNGHNPKSSPIENTVIHILKQHPEVQNKYVNYQTASANHHKQSNTRTLIAQHVVSKATLSKQKAQVTHNFTHYHKHKLQASRLSMQHNQFVTYTSQYIPQHNALTLTHRKPLFNTIILQIVNHKTISSAIITVNISSNHTTINHTIKHPQTPTTIIESSRKHTTHQTHKVPHTNNKHYQTVITKNQQRIIVSYYKCALYKYHKHNSNNISIKATLNTRPTQQQVYTQIQNISNVPTHQSNPGVHVLKSNICNLKKHTSNFIYPLQLQVTHLNP